jgi:hypothetical protein
LTWRDRRRVGGEFVMSKRASRSAPERAEGGWRLFCIRTS